MELKPEESAALVQSIRRFLAEELEQEVSGLQAKFLLDYVWAEIAPFAYNQGVRDAETYFRARVEDLPATCFRDGLTYWRQRRK